MRIGILEPEGFSSVALARLAKFGSVERYHGGDIGCFLADKEVLFIRLARRVDERLLAMAPNLKVLCSPTTGVTHIDGDALKARGVSLLTLKGEIAFLEGIHATAEHALGLIIGLLRRYARAFLVEGSRWDRDPHRGDELDGSAVGFIGFGRVARRVAGYLDAFGAKVGWYDPQVQDAGNNRMRFDSVRQLIEESGIVVLTASYEPGSPPILDTKLLGLLNGKHFVNIARGELIDEDALVATVEAGKLKGCALDVLCGEPAPRNLDRWLAVARTHNVIVTPHIGGATVHSMHRTEEFLVEKLFQSLGGSVAS